jgi:hypothetical protein
MNALFKRRQNKGLATTDALIADLKAREIEYKIKLGLDDWTEHLFITLLKSIKLALQH